MKNIISIILILASFCAFGQTDLKADTAFYYLKTDDDIYVHHNYEVRGAYTFKVTKKDAVKFTREEAERVITQRGDIKLFKERVYNPKRKRD
jgi:hypothetical protein